MEDVIKSYLVALGFKVDSASFSKMQDTLKNLNNDVQKTTRSMSTNYAVAASAIASSLSSVAFATVDLLDKVAQADLGYQKFALRMYMARDAAKSFKIVTDAMGESVNDIAWIPELNERYQKFMTDANRMNTPKDAEGQLRFIRDIRGEFTRLKIEATFGLQWVGYYLIKYLQEPLSATRWGFKDINDYIIAKMPEWSKTFAEVLGTLYKLLTDVTKPAKDVFDILKGLFDMLPDWGQDLVTFGAAFAVFFFAGPIGRAILVLSTLTLLMQDFFSYLNGDESNKELGSIWQKLLNVIGFAVEQMLKLIILSDIFSDKQKAHEFVTGLMYSPDEQKKAFDQRNEERRKLGRATIPDSEFKAASGRMLSDAVAQAYAENEKDNIPRFGERARLWDKYKIPGRWVNNPNGIGQIWVGQTAPPGMGGLIHQVNPALAPSGLPPGLPGVIDFESSGGDPTAQHPKTGAYGISQIMPGNWGPWSEEAKLGKNAENNLYNQQIVTMFKWKQYLNKYKDTRLAAAAWFGGPDKAERLMKGDMSALSVSDANNVTVGDYIKRTQGQEFTFPYTPNLPGGYSGPSTVDNSSYNITFQGLPEDQVRQVENIILHRQRLNVMPGLRIPAVQGAGQ